MIVLIDNCKKIVQLCETRWVQRHDAVLQFTVNLPDIVEALSKIGQWRNKDTAVKALNLVTTLCRFEFIVGLFCLSDILLLTQPLSVIQQKESIDITKASEVVTSLISSLTTQRSNVDEFFQSVFSNATQMAEKLNVEVKKPRICGRQRNRENHPVQNCEEYYKVTGYIPLIEMVTEDLKTRFSEEVLQGFNLNQLLPKHIVELNLEGISKLIKGLVERFGDMLEGNKDSMKLKLRGEILHWQQKWKNSKVSGTEMFDSAIEILESCDEDIYPAINTLLQLLCTLPATNASAERSFSSLRRIKTWLRTTMLEKRLNGLALLNIHYDITVKVIERFSKMGEHRMRIEL